MDVSQIHLFFLTTISIITLGLGVLVFIRKRKSVTNKSFLFFTLSTIVWIAFNYLCDEPFWAANALFWNRATMAAGFLTALFFLYFALVFSKEQARISFFWKIIFSINCIIIFLSLFTDLIVKDIQFLEWGTNIIGGDLYFLFFIFSIFIAGANIFIIIKKYTKAQGIKKVQLQYVSFGFYLYLIVTLTLNVILPTITGNNRFAKFGPYGSIFFIGFTALAITRYHLFEIKVILIELLVGVMGIVLFTLPFLMESFQLKFLTGGIFLLFCVFGYFLIKSTYREVGAKEILEQKVQERTRGIEKRKEDLERFYSLTVGRELKMIELKKKIKEIEEKN